MIQAYIGYFDDNFFLSRRCLTCMYFMFKNRLPSRSLDLNPMRWVWTDLKRYVRKKLCRTEKDILVAINEFHEKMTPKYCQNLIDKLHKVMNKVVKNNGGR